MFCMVSLRCFPEGPFPPTRPGQGRRETPALTPLAAARPPRPGVVRAGASAPTRSGAAGVAGGNRTDLGDQSVGGIGASRKPKDDAQLNHRPCWQECPIRPNRHENAPFRTFFASSCVAADKAGWNENGNNCRVWGAWRCRTVSARRGDACGSAWGGMKVFAAISSPK